MKSRTRLKARIFIGLEIVCIGLLIRMLFIEPVPSFILILLIFYDLKSKADSLTINNNGITKKNWLTFEKTFYSFSEFDKIVVYQDPMETMVRNNIFLLKDDIVFSKVSGRNFENLTELRDEIHRLKNLYTRQNIEM